jgi:RNHCP domain-containing protein
MKQDYGMSRWSRHSIPPDPQRQAGEPRPSRRSPRPARRFQRDQEPDNAPRDRKRSGAGGARRTRLPLDEISPRPYQRGRGHTLDESFKCGHCKRFIGPVPSGGRHRNHCPFCLYSKHVDAGQSGDRASACGALMAPIGAFQRPNGEHVVVHRCLGCGFERFNRIAADDDFDFVLSLPVLPPRSARRDLPGAPEPPEA